MDLILFSYKYFNIWNRHTESNSNPFCQIDVYWQKMPVKELWNYIHIYKILFFLKFHLAQTIYSMLGMTCHWIYSLYLLLSIHL